MKREAVEEFVSSVVEGILEGTEMELVDVEYVRERDWYLRVYLDKPGGVDLDDCQIVSEKLSEVLDAEDPIKENYLLEVSSPGLDRVLKKDKDFVRYQGADVDVQLFKPVDGKNNLPVHWASLPTRRLPFKWMKHRLCWNGALLLRFVCILNFKK